MKDAEARKMADRAAVALLQMDNELRALRAAHDELADEMMREHGIAAKDDYLAPGYSTFKAPVSPRRFAYDETRTLRRTKPSKAK